MSIEARTGFMVPGHSIENMEKATGDNYRAQIGDWLELPAQLDTTGAYSNLGYTEAQEAESIGWNRGLGKLQENSHWKWEPWTFVLHNLDHYGINLATYRAAGFVFNKDDIWNYIQWMRFDNLHWELSHHYEVWAKERDLYVVGNNEDHPDYKLARRRSSGLHQARRWAENFYLRGQTSGPVFVRGKLPPDWSMQDDGHYYGYWTAVLDEHGEEAATIFLKAMESCHMRLQAATWDEELGANCDHRW